MRQVERALFDLRRGVPVLLRGEAGDCLVASVEGAGTMLVEDMQQLAGSPCALLLGPHRLERLGVAASGSGGRVSIEAGDDHSQIVRWACAPDAVLPTARVAHNLDDNEQAALQLMRRGLLIPAALAAPIAPAAHAHVSEALADHRILAVSALDVATYERDTPALLRRISEANVPLEASEQSRFVVFREADGIREHVAILIGDSNDWPNPVPVRLHSACLTGDLFGSLRCDCGAQLRSSVETIANGGGGVLLYLAQEGRGIGLANKMRAYHMQDQGLDTVDADQVLGFGEDERNYGVAVEMLAQLDVQHIELLTNNPAKLDAMDSGTVTVAARREIYGLLTEQNARYLTTKATRAGHWLDALLAEPPGSSL